MGEPQTKNGLPRPQQKRSRETLQRILDAMEAALEDHTFEEVTVADLCRRASCSVGTFYGRVESKDGLLDHLRERVYEEMLAVFARIFDPVTYEGKSLPQILANQSVALVRLHFARKGVIRANVVQARRRAEFAVHTRRFNEAIIGRVSAAWLTRAEEITHDDPERAVQQAALMAGGYLREAVVFGELWPTKNLTPDEHIVELSEMLSRYLTGQAAPPAERAPE